MDATTNLLEMEVSQKQNERPPVSRVLADPFRATQLHRISIAFPGASVQIWRLLKHFQEKMGLDLLHYLVVQGRGVKISRHVCNLCRGDLRNSVRIRPTPTL